jgi:hypothetical protein
MLRGITTCLPWREKDDQMTKESQAKLTFTLFMIAAVLAFAAALIGYVASGEVRISLIAAGVFLVVFGFGTKGRMTPSK